MKGRGVHTLACFLVLLICGGLLFAQSDRATISGTVKDASSAVLPGVQVRVINTATNDAYNVITDNLGLYQVSNLPIGSYAVKFSKDGFRTLDRKGITLLIGQVAKIDAALQVGTRSEVIEVTAEAPVLQTETANLTTNLDSQAVSELPLNVNGGRNLASFIYAYVPGVQGNGTGADADYSSHINGSMAMSKEVMIDGVSAVSQLGGYISETQPSIESVQEFQVETAGISAEAGRTGGGVFRYEMKSGSNAWHGSASGFMHDAALDALSANSKLSAQNNPVNAKVYLHKSETLSDWAVSGGGPILKDKLFFYAAFGRYMQSNWNLGAPGNTVPTDAMMGLNADGSVAPYADFSVAAPNGIIDPTTGQPFPNNQIPTSRISPVTAKILQVYHKYYAPEVGGNQPQNNAMPASKIPWNHINETSLKLDYNLSDKHRLSAVYIYNFSPRILADQGGIWSPNAPHGGGPLANAYEHDTKSPSFRLNDSYNFGPNVINSFHFAINRFRNPSVAKSQSGGWNSVLGLGDGVGNFPKISLNGGWYGNCCVSGNAWSFGGLGSQFNDFYAGNTFIYSDDVSWVKGRHTYKFGAEFRAMQFNNHGDLGVYSVTFDPLTTGNSYNNNGSALASMLLGNANSGGLGEFSQTYGRRKAFSLYASDNIKVTSKLTLNVDLRWDYNNPYKEKYGHWSNFNIQEKNPVTGLMGTMDYLGNGSKSFEKRQDWTNFAPHIGAAYAITPKTVIRGTYSIFYVPLNMNTWAAIPYGFDPGFKNSNAATAFNWNNGYVGNITNVQTPDYHQWGMVYVDPRALTPGNTQQFTIGVQRELTKDMKLDVSYIQSASYHLQSGTLETNQPTVANMQAYVNNGTLPASYNHYYSGGPGYLGITPYPQAAVDYGPLFSVGAPLGNSTYKGLQFSVTKRASHGLSMQGSYVYSKTRGDVDTSMSELWSAGSIQNVYDLKNERKNISSFDMTHVVKGYVMYDLPFGRNKLLGSGVGPVMNDVIGGWSVNFGYQYNTGTPMQIHAASAYPGYNSLYVNLVPGCKMTIGSPRVGQQYLNKSCFQTPANGELGTAGNYLDGLRNPGLATEDMSVHKALGFGPEDRYKLTLRLEFFNVFNRHQVGSAVSDMSKENFGEVIKYGDQGGRVGQFGARFTF